MTLPATIGDIETDFYCELTRSGLITLNGPDSDTFLQGQLTIDIPSLQSSQARRAAHCDFKGKAWSLPLVLRLQDGIGLSLNKSSLAMTLAQLNKYGVFSKTDIVDSSDSFRQFIARGQAVEAWIAGRFDSVPSSSLNCVSNDDGAVISTDFDDAVYHLILTNEAAASLSKSLADADIHHYDENVSEALHIRAGIPDVSDDNVNEFVPQMMNVQALNAIDFGKGCYMGQEVVARTRYLGKNKRAAYVFCVPESLSVKADSLVEKQLGENWRRGGSIIRRAVLGDETWLMAVLNNDTRDEDVFRIKDTTSPTFSCQSLPYSVEQETNNVRGRS
ncbi:tRNA-modifying protein YgfZ [Salinimonas sp. HHU 13199]|uniref:tRNA-modifying protein YgfZ n=1 Tax=Salinimonas profundi TaxID=2729140 RepID=A0ABR8LNK0_9ALTE|nr:tRNA-modifying protein YgfZ [Salinimonas profundi]MBD3587302.1 tRNA-modifying protein YgfZ [Salinimonas profundi]